MQHCDTLIAPRWCVPVAPAGTILDNHAVVVQDGRIAAILPRDRALAEYQPSVCQERPSHALIPGLVNAHTHAAMALFRGFADDLPLESWLRRRIWPAEQRWVSAEFVRDGTDLAIAEMIASGTTCFADQYFFPEIVAEAAVDLHMRAVVGTPVADFPSNWAGDVAEYLQKGADLVHDPYADHPLIATAFAPHSALALSDASFAALRVMADQLDAPVQMHVHESRAEIERSIEQNGKRPFARLADAGLVNASLLGIHAVHLNDDEVARCAASGVSLVHCPSSNLKLASGIAPVARYRASGVNVALGTDSAASNNRLDLLTELRTAALLAKVVDGDAAALSATDALSMATLGGARALGIADRVGSIEPGKWADLACIDLGAPAAQPVYDVVSQLVYTAQASQVSDVWVGGRHLLEEGRYTHIDAAGVLRRADEWRARIAATAEID